MTHPTTSDDASPRRILVVDDDPTMLELLETILAPLGTVEVATDGIDGIARFRSACECRRPFDLVCLDLRMPGMDGHRTLSALRRMERSHLGAVSRAGAQILMLTAVSDRTSVQRAVSAGCDGYLVKPFSADEVMRKLQELGFALATAP
jgi:two-component system chemotaxis response regulator CheY